MIADDSNLCSENASYVSAQPLPSSLQLGRISVAERVGADIEPVIGDRTDRSLA
jgi:hypothetical protein